MKAMVRDRYGGPEVLRYGELERPEPGEGEVLVKVEAASINKADRIVMKGKPFIVRLMASGLLRPKQRIIGSDIAGRVEAVGRAVTRFRPGDEVFGDLLGFGMGGYAEYVSTGEQALALKPSNITFEQAAAAPMAGLTALQALRDKGGIVKGNKVLVHGASGGVGTFAVQIAKAFGAEVTAVCSSRHVDMARSIGADRVIDYTKEDFVEDGALFDIILGVNGNRPIGDYGKVLAPRGVYVMVGGTGRQIAQAMFLGPLLSRRQGKRFTHLSAKPKVETLEALARLLASGQVLPVIERSYPLSRLSEAMSYLEEGHALGKVVITIP